MRTILLLGATLALCGCDSDELRISLVPKQGASAPSMGSPGMGSNPHAAEGASGPTLHWTLPEGWSESAPEAGSMRYATLHAPTPQGALDVGVFRFPGTAGGLLPNVNRWREQLGLEPVDEASLPSVVREAPGKPGVLMIDWTSSDQGQGLLAAIVTLPSETWFLKAPGAAPMLAASREGFATLIESLHLAAGDHAHGAPPMEEPPPPPAEAPLPAWTVPATWRSESPRPPRLASFAVGNEANVAVTRFPGDVGGALANLNRWRQQVGLPALEQAPTPEQRVVDGEAGQWIDLRGPSERMLICAVPHGGQTWFLKLRGPVAEVDGAEAEFAEFLDSLRWAAAPPAPQASSTPPQAPLLAPQPQGPIAPPAGEPELALRWTLPETWTQAAEPGRMRLATVRAGTAELSVTRFPGDVGGLLQNVNRWRLQIGLEPVLRAEDQAMTPLDVGGLPATRVDLDGPERALRVVLIPRAGQTWFVKLVGSPAEVSAEEARFTEFVSTLRFAGGAQ
ncbi:MAG: hypothetical protein KDD82_04705 [Planctomycetes bacterium]|nr:hypothetical protein [Planctomycetota bacterium]